MKRTISGLLAMTLAFIMCGTLPPQVAAAEDAPLYSQNFDTITDISQDTAISTNSNSVATYNIVNQELVFAKDSTGGCQVYFKFAPYLGDVTSYSVTFDMRTDLNAAGTMGIWLGGRVSLRGSSKREANMLVTRFHKGGSDGWESDGTTVYDFNTSRTIKMVKTGESVDFYIDNQLVKAGMLLVQDADPFSQLRFDFDNSATGSIYIDNITVAPYVAEEPVENQVQQSDVPTVGTPEVSKQNFDIWLAIGQSNMAGRAPMEREDQISIPNVYLLNGSDQWETAQAQYVDGKWCGFNRYSTVRKTDAVQGVSPAFYFAKTLAEQFGSESTKIGIVSNARGDTSIRAWQKGYEGDDLNLYEEAVRRAQIAMEAGTLRGIIWHQGCKDVTMDHATYIELFETMVTNLRADLGNADLPIIVGEIPGYAISDELRTNRMNLNQHGISKLPGAVRNCWCISSAGNTDIGDMVHFSTLSQRRMGALYGKVALREVYGIAPAEDGTLELEAPVSSDGGTTAAIAADGIADVTAYDDTAAYWQGVSGGYWQAEFGGEMTVSAVKSYFHNPYNYTYQYKILLRQEGSWNVIVDNSAITAYGEIDETGAVIDAIENLSADAVRIEFTGVLGYDGATASVAPGCHEFAVSSPDAARGVRVWFDGYAGRATIPVQSATTLELKATADGEITDIVVYADGTPLQTLTAAPYLLDISTLGVRNTTLRAVATDAFGQTGEVTLELAITASFLYPEFSDSDFIMVSDRLTESGINTYPQRGYVEAAQVDAAHGTSMKVGIETVNASYDTGKLPYIQIPLNGIGGKVTISFDVYVSAKDTSGDKKITMHCSNERTLLQFKEEVTVLGDSTHTYEAGKWYSYKLEVDMAARTVDYYQDGVLISAAAPLGNTSDVISHMRLYGPRMDDVPSYTAIDNIVVSRLVAVPMILSIGDNNQVSAEAESFDVYVSEELYAPSLTTESVTLLDESGNPCAISKLAYTAGDMKITVTPATRLLSNSGYTVVLSEAVEVSADIPIGMTVSGAFHTQLQEVDIASAVFGYAAGSRTARTTVQNSSGEEKTVYAVMTLWEGNVFAGMDIAVCTAPAGAQAEVTLSAAVPEGAAAEVCLYSSLAVPQMLSGKVFRYSTNP